MKMPFGKYGPNKFPPAGVDICFINSGYLKWLLEQDWFIMERDEREAIAVQKELEMRDMDSSHFYKDKVSLKNKSQ